MTPALSKPFIYLASASPRRRELLAQVGIPVKLISGEIDETPLTDESPAAYVERLAFAKARAGYATLRATGLPPGLLLAADTTVALGSEIFGKPEHADDAMRMLARLSASEHEVLTAVAVSDGERFEAIVSVSSVRFRALQAAEIAAYVASGEPMDKAGAYGIQGLGAVLVDTIKGSFSGIVGLPVAETVALLQRFAYPFWGVSP